MRVASILGIGLFVLGFFAFAWPSLYIYSPATGPDLYRFNRFSGVREHATQWGWLTDDQEVKAADKALTKSQIDDINQNKVASVSLMNGQLCLYYTNQNNCIHVLEGFDAVTDAAKAKNIYQGAQ